MIPKFLVFSWDGWDDDRRAGWRGCVHRSAAAAPEDVRREMGSLALVKHASEPHGILINTHAYGDTYEIVSTETFTVVEHGRIEFDWAEDGNTWAWVKMLPSTEPWDGD